MIRRAMSFYQDGAPQWFDVCWFINPMNTIVISTINHGIQPLIRQLNAIWGGAHPVWSHNPLLYVIYSKLGLIFTNWHIFWQFIWDTLLTFYPTCILAFYLTCYMTCIGKLCLTSIWRSVSDMQSDISSGILSANISSDFLSWRIPRHSI